MKWFQKTAVRVLALVLAVAAVATVLVVTSAEEVNVYNDTNPELKEALISTGRQSTQYDNASDYTPYATFGQGNGKYSIETDAHSIWSSADDCAFLYQEYEIGNKPTDKLTITVDLTSFYGTKNGKHSNASAGIMIRDDLSPGASSLFFHSRTIGIYNIWRKVANEGSGYASSSLTENYPLALKIEKVGNKYTASYKLKGTNAWSVHSITYLNLTGTIYVGLTAHCSDEKKPVFAEFGNLLIEGQGTPDLPSEDGGTGDGGGSADVPVVGEGVPWEDAPYDEKNTLLYETFTDGSMIMGEESVTNPIWDTEYPNVVLMEDGDRKWYRDHITSFDHIGNPKWTDYTASIDVAFDNDDIATRSTGNFIFYTRHSVVHSLGHTAYGVRLYAKTVGDTTTYHIALLKRYRNSKGSTHRITYEVKDIDDFFGDGTHNIKVRCFDNNITVWFDEELMFDHYDNGASSFTDPNGAFVASMGNLSIYSKDIGVYVDNILVTKLEDLHGGDYDNQIGGNWDEDIPDYVLDFNK